MGGDSFHPIVFSDGRLIYINHEALHVPPVLYKLYGEQVRSLDVSYNKLQNLNGIENFQNVTEIIADNNEIDDSVTFTTMSCLHTLSLNNNKITDLEWLIRNIKLNLPKLQYLSLLGNIACPNELSDANKDEGDYQRYRYYVLHHLPNLKFLDSRVVNQEELTEGKKRGHYMIIVRPKNSYSGPVTESRVKNYMYHTPLPQENRDLNDHQGIYSRCIYRYTGKHSEGNRFISNNDL